MKKIYISLLCVTSSFFFVSAQGGDTVPAQPMPIKAVKVSTDGGIQAMMGDDAHPMLTGDKAIDDKIKALVKERDQKIKAIHDEFQAKLKALIGERKVLRASTTEQRKDEMRERAMNASGTPMRPEERPRPPMGQNAPLRGEGNRPAEQNSQNMLQRLFQPFRGNN